MQIAPAPAAPSQSQKTEAEQNILRRSVARLGTEAPSAASGSVFATHCRQYHAAPPEERDHGKFYRFLSDPRFVSALLTKANETDLHPEERAFVDAIFLHGNLAEVKRPAMSPAEKLNYWRTQLRYAEEGKMPLQKLKAVVFCLYLDDLKTSGTPPEQCDAMLLEEFWNCAAIGDENVRKAAITAFFCTTGDHIKSVMRGLGLEGYKLVGLNSFQRHAMNFRDRDGKTITLIDAQNHELNFIPTEDIKPPPYDAADDPYAPNSHAFFIQNPAPDFTLDGQEYLRVAIPGHPEIVLGYPATLMGEIPGDMEKFKLFLSTRDGLKPITAKDIIIESTPPFPSSEEVGPKISNIACDVIPGSKHEPRHRFSLTSETGAVFMMDVNGAFWDDLATNSDLQKLSQSNLELPTLAIFMGAMQMLPFQALSQFSGPYQIVTKKNPGQKENEWVIADSVGHIFAMPKSFWNSNNLRFTLTHENMGHNTEAMIGRHILAPLLILLALKDEYEPRDGTKGDGEYAKTNIREFWATAHEDYIKNPRIFRKAYPHVAALLQSVYTPDGRRFEGRFLSFEDLGFKIK